MEEAARQEPPVLSVGDRGTEQETVVGDRVVTPLDQIDQHVDGDQGDRHLRLETQVLGPVDLLTGLGDAFGTVEPDRRRMHVRGADRTVATLTAGGGGPIRVAVAPGGLVDHDEWSFLERAARKRSRSGGGGTSPAQRKCRGHKRASAEKVEVLTEIRDNLIGT